MKERGSVHEGVFAGKNLLSFPRDQLLAFAKQVSGKLETKPNTMMQYSAEELLMSIQEGRAVCLLGENGGLLAFAQVWPYIFEETEEFYDGENLQEKKVFEAGSWLSFGRGQGPKVFEAAVALGIELDPDAFIVAITESGNEKAAGILQSIGGKPIGQKRSLRVLDKDHNPALMKIYGMNG